MDGTGVWASNRWLTSRLALRIGDMYEVPLQIGPAAVEVTVNAQASPLLTKGCACSRRLTGKPEGHQQVSALRALSR
jgi:hypothetical protein